MRRTPRILLPILLLSVVLRIAVALYLGNVVDAPPLLTDQRSYHALGARLVAGRGFSFDIGWYPFTRPDTPTAHWSFLYSLFVAAVYAVAGVQPLAARVVQAVLGGVLLPWMAFLLTCRLFAVPPNVVPYAEEASTQARETNPTRAEVLGLLAAAIVAIYPYFVLYSATLMTEAFYLTALMWSMERALAVRERLTQHQDIGVSLAFTFGLSLGIAVLLRQSILPWVVVLFVWLFWIGRRLGQSRGVIKALATALVPIVFLILPFTIRNYHVYGSFLLLNSNAGYAMYSAQHPMHGTEFQEFAAAPVPDDIAGLNEAQMDRELMRRGIGFVMADPQRYLLLSLSRVRAYLDFRPSEASSRVNAVGRVLAFGVFVPLMVYGIWLALRAARARARATAAPRQAEGVRSGKTRAGALADFLTTPLALILVFAVFYSVLHIMTWAMPRYRLPVDAVLMPFAALAVLDLAQRTRFGRRLPSASP
jgi:hypothetical protein